VATCGQVPLARHHTAAATPTGRAAARTTRRPARTLPARLQPHPASWPLWGYQPGCHHRGSASDSDRTRPGSVHRLHPEGAGPAASGRPGRRAPCRQPHPFIHPELRESWRPVPRMMLEVGNSAIDALGRRPHGPLGHHAQLVYLATPASRGKAVLSTTTRVIRPLASCRPRSWRLTAT
jgi:hypothetical protein